jgi:3-dehydroquinate synthase
MFQVEKTSFKIETRYSNNLIVKSYDKEYSIDVISENINRIIENNFVSGDYIIADKFFEEQIINPNIIFIEATEENKCMDTVLNIFDKLYEKKFTKKNKLIVIGGGIIQDISGFLCGMYKRGIKWVLVPTTMLAMTDSCIGGKVCLNRGGKNMLGLFVSPSKIVISDLFLKTLDNDMIISGIGESLKLAIIAGENEVNNFTKMLNNKDYVGIIKQSLEIKKTIVEYDELERNERRVLNYGHTIGHAIEAATNYFIPHGIAVLIGMYYINRLFVKTNDFDKINELILSLIPKKYLIRINIDILGNFMLSDKKNMGNDICFIVLEKYGKSQFIFKNIDDVKKELINILF